MKPNFRDRVAEYFRAHPQQWISYRRLMALGGLCAWRTRCSECRTQLGMTIDNRIVRTAEGIAMSYYRYRPTVRRHGGAR